jgi:hypothetical protein
VVDETSVLAMGCATMFALGVLGGMYSSLLPKLNLFVAFAYAYAGRPPCRMANFQEAMETVRLVHVPRIVTNSKLSQLPGCSTALI